jgi:thioredoxin-dependent peroxiredoxin
VSADSKDSHQAFAQKHSLPYLLLIDKNKALRKKWKVPKSLMILDGRASYLIDKNGICRFRFVSSTEPKKHIYACLQKLKELN